MLLLFIAWMGLGVGILKYEPFSAFLFQHASWIVLILAGSVLSISVVIPRPWCRFVCPMGQILSWIQKME
jgi:polyferredoxin